MHEILNNTTVLVVLSTEVLFLLALAYVIVLLTGNKKIISLQKAQLDEIATREQKYKALFENSVAGMMTFNFMTWKVLEANRAVLEMFNCTTVEKLQDSFLELPVEQFHEIGASLHSVGSVDGIEIQRTIQEKIVRRYLFSARREGSTECAHAVIIYMTAQKRIG